MLRTRLWMGAILIALTVGVLVLDQRLAPWYPFLFGLIVALSLIGCVELRRLLSPARRPAAWLCVAAVIGLACANWIDHLLPESARQGPWFWLAGVFGAVALAAFVVEMATFHEPGESVN